MTDTLEPPSAHPDCPAIADEFARRLSGLGLESLRVMLQVLQARLGTAEEEPCDFEKARVLGHEINNRLTVTDIELDLRRLDGPQSDSF